MTPVLTAKHLSHTYADGRQALHDVSFALAAHDAVALVGPNGAGKTTLFLRLCGVLPGLRGEATVADLDPADPAHRAKLPETLGVVFQSPDDQLFSATIFDDVAFGPLNLGLPADAVKTRVAAALKCVGLAGYDERVPHRLSGGEKRRAAIATVLSMQPGILLLDEPTLSLDPRGRRELIVLLQSLPGTKLIATHDLDFALDVCPRTLLLADGRLIAEGPTHEILGNVALMEEHELEVPWRLRLLSPPVSGEGF